MVIATGPGTESVGLARLTARMTGSGIAIALVCAAYTLAQAFLVAPGLGLGFDETIYVSQVSPHAPAAFFSAPRARGVSALVAPLVALTGQTFALRIYLALLSGAGLFAALWVWRPLCRTGVLPLAGALFASLWVSEFYGVEAMPNLWVALASLTAVGCFLRAVDDAADRRILSVLGVSVIVIALMRPTDAVWVIVPLIVATLAVPRWRRPALTVTLVGGLLVGSAPWVVEAYTRYGGVIARLHQSSRIEGGFGLNFAAMDQLKAQSGRLLCRPCTMPWHHPIASAWLIALPMLAAVAVLVAIRQQRRTTTLVPMACAAAISVPYLVLVNYAAPRFLLPVYALLAIPVANLLITAIGRARPRLRPMVIAVSVVVLAGHLVIQYAVLTHTVRGAVTASGDVTRIATQLAAWGVRAPCVIAGDQAIPIAFSARCFSAATGGNNANSSDPQLADAAHHERVVIVLPPGRRPPAFVRGWPSQSVRGMTAYAGYRLYISLPPPTA